MTRHLFNDFANEDKNNIGLLAALFLAIVFAGCSNNTQPKTDETYQPTSCNVDTDCPNSSWSHCDTEKQYCRGGGKICKENKTK